MASAKDTAIVLSDCQGPAIAWVIGQLPAVREHYEFRHYQSWHKPGPLSSVPAEALERCRLMFYQVVEGIPVETIRAGVPEGCELVLFGSPAFPALYPWRSRWPRDGAGQPQCALHPELADRYAIALIKSGVDKAEYLSRYFDFPVAADVDLEAGFELDCARLERADLDIEITVADFICSNIRRTKLFHCADHPTNALYFYQMGKMFDLCRRRGLRGFEDTAGLKAALREVERNGPASFGATEFFGDVQTPVHPDVIEGLGLEFCTAETVYENRGLGRWTHRAYIGGIYDHLTGAVQGVPESVPESVPEGRGRGVLRAGLRRAGPHGRSGEARLGTV